MSRVKEKLLCPSCGHPKKWFEQECDWCTDGPLLNETFGYEPGEEEETL